MAKDRKNTIPILIDIRYAHSINQFEEFYGDHVSYSEIEQESYIDLKNMMFEKICNEIKFRKFNRENNVLTIKADMLDREYKLFIDILEGKSHGNKIDKSKKISVTHKGINGGFNFFHDFKISRVKTMTREDLLNCKKIFDEYDLDELDEEENNEQ